MAKPPFHQVVELKDVKPPRTSDRETSRDRYGAFARTAAYDDGSGLFPVEWFDSRPERTVANMLDDDQTPDDGPTTSAPKTVDCKWRYLLVSETHVETARDRGKP